jgi:hypothetical protein
VKANKLRGIADKLISKTISEVLKQALEKVKQSSNTELKKWKGLINIKNLIS